MKRNIEHRVDMEEQRRNRSKVTPVLTINGVSVEEFIGTAWDAGQKAQGADESGLIVPGGATETDTGGN